MGRRCLSSGARCEQRVERTLAAGGRRKMGVEKAAMPVEIDGAIDLDVLEQKGDRSVGTRRGLDRLLQRVAVASLAVHRDDLRADRQPCVERLAAPELRGDLAVLR